MKRIIKIILIVLFTGLIISPADFLPGMLLDDLLYLLAIIVVNRMGDRRRTLPENEDKDIIDSE